MTPRPLRGSITAMSLAAAMLLAGCSDDMSGMPMGDQTTAPSSTAPASTAAAFNDADVAFAQMMIPHHEQAVAMSEIVLTKPGLNADVQTVAIEIKNAQQPEIDTMRGWLTAWGKGPTTEGTDGDMGGMDHGGDDGMATAGQMQQLEKADTASGQKMYLEMMITHHQGAIRMARDEIIAGQNPQAVELARTIDTTQQTEITQMNKLLGQL